MPARGVVLEGLTGGPFADAEMRIRQQEHVRLPARLIHTAYRRYGYRLAEIAAHLGVHAATVSRRLKQAEQGNA